MAKYIVKHTTLMHSGKTYSEGSEIELTDKEAERLADFVEVVPKQQATSNKSNSNTQNKTQTSKSSTKAKSTTVSEPKKEDGSADSEGGTNGDK